MVRGLGVLLHLLFGRGKGGRPEGPLVPERCLVCGADLVGQESYHQWRVCPSCRFHYSLPARERIALLADPKSFKEKYRTITSLDPLSFSGKVPYRRRLFREQRRTGLTDAAIVGPCRIGGVKVVLLLLDFSFLGGSMGCVVGEKVALAFEYAARKKRPLVAVVTSGGVRLQEGPLSLMQMAKAVAAVEKFHRAGAPYIAVLASPTTGQAYASFVNLADIILAEPGALLGFAPLRSLQASSDVPVEVHTAEAHMARGMVDGIVDRVEVRPLLIHLLSLLSTGRGAGLPRLEGGRPRPQPSSPPAWEAVQLARHPERPRVRDYIARLFSGFVELHGDRVSSDDPQVVCGVASLEGQTVMVVGHQPEAPSEDGRLGPGGFRKARRAMTLAAKFSIPLITLIDTPGPALTVEAEEGGIGQAIATTIATMVDLPVPTVGVVIGEGGQEAALAFAVADRLLMLQNAFLTPISPERAATLMFRDEERVEEAAEALHLTASDCLEMGLVDEVVPEPQGGAQADLEETVRLLRQALLRALRPLLDLSRERLIKQRYQRFRRMGEYTSYFRAVLAREIDLLRASRAPQAPRTGERKGK